MKIKTTYSSLVSVLNLMGNVVASNKSLQDDYKVVNIFAKNNGIDTKKAIILWKILLYRGRDKYSIVVINSPLS